MRVCGGGRYMCVPFLMNHCFSAYTRALSVSAFGTAISYRNMHCTRKTVPNTILNHHLTPPSATVATSNMSCFFSTSTHLTVLSPTAASLKLEWN